MKNNSVKNLLLYIALVLLIFLLLLPPGLRLFLKEEKVEKKRDITIILTCSKDGEMIVTSYLNDEPYSLYYNVSGNHTTNNEDSEKENNQIVMDILPVAKVSYNDIRNITEFTIDLKNLNTLNSIKDYVKDPTSQNSYYTSKGFWCTKSVS